MNHQMIQSWESLREFYSLREIEGNRSVGAMVELISQIQNSSYESGLHAWTSMFDLCVVQMPVSYPYSRPFLKISPTRDGMLDFRFIDCYAPQKQWHRIVAGSEGFLTLAKFLDQVHWFNFAMRE